jgi:hypothetical protein
LLSISETLFSDSLAIYYDKVFPDPYNNVSLRQCLDQIERQAWPLNSLSFFISALAELSGPGSKLSDSNKRLICEYIAAARLRAGVLPQLKYCMSDLRSPVRLYLSLLHLATASDTE